MWWDEGCLRKVGQCLRGVFLGIGVVGDLFEHSGQRSQKVHDLVLIESQILDGGEVRGGYLPCDAGGERRCCLGGCVGCWLSQG